MAETLTVALRVAEEAIEEAITKAEEFSDSLVRLLGASVQESYIENPLVLISQNVILGSTKRRFYRGAVSALGRRALVKVLNYHTTTKMHEDIFLLF